MLDDYENDAVFIFFKKGKNHKIKKISSLIFAK